MIEMVVLGAITAALRWANSSSTSSAKSIETPPMPPSDVDGHILAETLPQKAGEAREQAILDLAQQGLIPKPMLVHVTYQKAGHNIDLFPATDALMLGTVHPVRLTVRHPTAQKLADFFGLMLPTTLMSDMAWLAAKQIPPKPGPSDAAMSDTSRMIEHSDRVDAAIKAAGAPFFARPVGKDWVNTERLLNPDGSLAAPVGSIGNKSLPAAANFGWHMRNATSHSPGGLPVIQSVGLAHDANHTDYSQVVTLYGPTVSVDGGPLEPIASILLDPARAFLLSDEVREGQAARVTRYPAVPLENA